MSYTIYIFEHASSVEPIPPTYFIERSLIVPSIELSYSRSVPPLTQVRKMTTHNDIVQYWADFGRDTELMVGTSRPIIVQSTKEHL